MYNVPSYAILKQDLGQVWTPEQIANDMAKDCLALLNNNKVSKISVLDPACGPATFQKALLKAGIKIDNFTIYDIDKRMTDTTSSFFRKNKIIFCSKNKDYLLDRCSNKYNLIITNPPYIRHENFDASYKNKVKSLLESRNITKINGRSNIFIYFLYKAITELNENGILCAILYDAVLQSQYGKEFIQHLQNECFLEKVKQVKTPFDNTLIDATIIYARKKANKSNIIDFTCSLGRELKNGEVYLENLLEISRGTSLPLRKIFIIKNTTTNFKNHSRPIIVKPNLKDSLVVTAPDSQALFFGYDTTIDRYLSDQMHKLNIACKFKPKEKKGPIIMNYYIRSEPKHLYNIDKITASDNFYVSNVLHDFPSEIAWLLLNSTEYKRRIMINSRNQGNGLRKLQVYEYKSAIVPDWRIAPREYLHKIRKHLKKLILKNPNISEVQHLSDNIYEEIFG